MLVLLLKYVEKKKKHNFRIFNKTTAMGLMSEQNQVSFKLFCKL